mmetsp:Transcript_36717/g.89394  ORF Transcript_36717/g.89394 Transcript_36717/m.89394 type:complete len:80 (+) Transcript_36717:101-340(+)
MLSFACRSACSTRGDRKDQYEWHHPSSGEVYKKLDIGTYLMIMRPSEALHLAEWNTMVHLMKGNIGRVRHPPRNVVSCV